MATATATAAATAAGGGEAARRPAGPCGADAAGQHAAFLTGAGVLADCRAVGNRVRAQRTALLPAVLQL
jgi:hypothetical protein